MVNASAEQDTACVLRFFGWMQRTNAVPPDASLDIAFFARADVGTKAQQAEAQDRSPTHPTSPLTRPPRPPHTRAHGLIAPTVLQLA